MSTRGPSARPERPYRGRAVAVGTRHGKQHQFAPAFTEILGARLVTAPDLDTDQFGTFSGETPRRSTAMEAAIAKARLGMEVCGLPLGLASEASYGILPDGGWPGHEEIAVFVDDDLDIEVIEGVRTMSIPGPRHAVADRADLPEYLVAGLPDQALIVRAEGVEPIKGITGVAALDTAIRTVSRRSPDGLATVEPDLRAHHNPSRRIVLTTLAERLARRLATLCPSCAAPGFGRVQTLDGLPCGLCGTPTPAARAEVHGCPRCAHTSTACLAGTADPAVCPECNP